MTQQTHSFSLDMVDPSSQLGISHRAGCQHGSNSSMGGVQGGASGGCWPPVYQGVVGCLDGVVRTGVGSNKELVPEPNQGGATLDGIFDGLGRELSRQGHGIADAEGSDIGVTDGVRSSAHEGRHMPMSGRSNQSINVVRKGIDGAAKCFHRKNYGNDGVGMITDQEGDKVIVDVG